VGSRLSLKNIGYQSGYLREFKAKTARKRLFCVGY